MKKNVVVLIACWAVGTGAFAQVGIHTDPQGMFHIDALGDTNGSLNTSDDVIVTNEGNVGIGAIPPAASTVRLLVTDGGTSAVPKSPLRIVDGNQEGGKVLTSINNNGDARWQALPGQVAPGEAYGLYTIPAQTIHEHQNNNTMYDIGFSFTASVNGFYAFEVRWWGVHRDGNKNVAEALLHCRLYIGNTPTSEEYETYVTLNGTDASHFCTCFTLYYDVTSVTTFRMRVRPSYYMNIEENDLTPWTKAKINVLRIN
jgi:hypothetical protein